MSALVRKRMPELDTLRGVAILLVVLYHGLFWSLQDDQLTPAARQIGLLFRGGWCGVQLFFVLSGFLITGILADSKGRSSYFRTFYLRRALRILPVLLLFIAILLATHVVTWKFALLSIAFLANVAQLLGVPLQYPPLWSLAVEEHFYALWPATVRWMSLRGVAITSLALFVISPAIRAFAFAQGATDGMAYYTWFTLDGLALGGLMAIVARIGSRKAFTIGAVAILAIGFLGGATLVMTHEWSRNTIIGAAFSPTMLYFLFGGTIAASLLIGSSSRSALVNIRWLQFLGDISYGLYLIHLLCFWLYDRVVTKQGTLTAAFVLARFAIAGGAAIILATLSRRYFESRFLRMKERITPPGAPSSLLY